MIRCMIGDRWGVSECETRRPYPCDDFVASPVLQAWRGVHVQAPAEAVWPWVAQVRLAPYSYDWIDYRCRRSPRELVGLQEPRAGERLTAVGGRALGRIVSVDSGRQLASEAGFILDWQHLDADRNITASAAIMRGDPALMRKMLDEPVRES
jgi:hypothetical protein